MKIHVDPRLVLNAASSYSRDIRRVITEYVDNSIDSAEKNYFNKEKNSYTKEILIDIIIDRKLHKISVRDNCGGIDDIKRVSEKIGDSNRREDENQNGQFGFGMQSFLTFGEKAVLEVVSKVKCDDARYICIPANTFLKGVDAEVADPIIVDYEYDSGTLITISKIGKDVFKEFEIKKFMDGISKHFEKILDRGNLKIRIIEGNSSYVCEPFDYSQFKGEIFEKEESSPFLSGTQSIKIFLKTTEDIQLSRPPFFIIKGRRINDVMNIKKFMSLSGFKKKIRDNPNITGYIDLGNTVEPTLDRTDIKHCWESQAAFKLIIKEENAINEFLEKINRETQDKNYNNLSDYLEKKLSKAARFDRMNYKETIDEGTITNDKSNINLGTVSGIGGDYGFGSQDFNNGNINNTEGQRSFGGGEGDGFGPNDLKGNSFPGDEPEKDSKFKGLYGFGDLLINSTPKKHSGFGIRFVDGEPPLNSITGKKVRSDISGGEIRIYKEHEDFKQRLSKSQNGVDQISERLILYLAGEISVHYKDEYYNKKRQQPEYDKQLFVNLFDFYYNFESSLKELVGKNLSDI